MRHTSVFGHVTVDNASSNVHLRDGVLAVNSRSCTIDVRHGIILLLFSLFDERSRVVRIIEYSFTTHNY